ncbi:transporter substrate-binding domain-containing protein [Mycobacterium montefiorense]|uniref:Cyclohexadienyl dehydratase n=1 Tax=Mycobacterium montefiorense TaxID=154654 RepID=A0AA37UUA4_9MYCO|nr:transporter substrate-binding domain-containing protein [Mycobacterium montefiorense]GBG37661.1 cyclohexadienyl dehydratase [Mycobacterium montefiorense]GKU34798.1 cyclohexadienyl dehydratase [Mycobacterium montefiorense]GKU40812.1 cyclohexadienyl dehydratase [Mycobacterium montefiorense]GKU46919.1 cyclohexadienyl dehydratase [Mycobacterium montefiorense]GKU49039.1 cyclohexadienyl dehydratase [Mycobacterium montefiorense]
MPVLRRGTTAASTVAALLVVAACGNTAPQSPPPAGKPPTALDRIVHDKVVRVCSTGDYRPFTFRDSQGSWSGLDIDMAHDLADRLGARLDLIPSTWAHIVTDVGTRCDLAMGGISISLKRAQQALYSSPYLRDGKAAIIRCTDSDKYRTLADIDTAGVRVVENPGGTNAEFAKSHITHAQVIEFPDNTMIFDQLANNAADVMFTDTSEIRYQIAQNPRLCGVAADRPLTFEQKAYLLPAGEAGLQQYVDQWLNIAQHDGTYARLSTRYLGSVIGP